ncbi:endonuclease/exonuclease/phosphatase family protein [Levilactobacillus tujiorum]|uniref:Endonuclease/exonuclease/phosphatase family protein n=1 Tax=Levilactobacillus tujiorum TaxID=2912243 RepID=A0ABX1L506_9LACO|nr:endonuclease/exonuclease/phosphatase family protein [Levilactobacillus tujiorum]MCH5465150.1 endonuclease/exonuclease/phosphatase family protein [Levilactobacillus tujiorum]NLR12772.1 endonuclease/exonuclease/phosphatase family protein [Lactobacillus sp. HBUAS51387]NLR30117.1 endonuclease/exonuclease/phosphatase family protein [Levilactobacillus tujiorum]
MPRLKILEWNINQRTTGNRMPDYIIPEILAKDPDVIVLVEFKGEENLTTLKAGLSDEYFLASYHGVCESKDNADKNKTGNGIFIALKKDKFEDTTSKSTSQQAFSSKHKSYDEPNWLRIPGTLKDKDIKQTIEIVGVRVRIGNEKKKENEALKSIKRQISWICSENKNDSPLLMIGDLNYGPHRTDKIMRDSLNWQDIIEVMRQKGALKIEGVTKLADVDFKSYSPYSPYAPAGYSFKGETLDWLVARNISIDTASDYNAFSWQFGKHNTRKFVPGYLTLDNYFIRTDPSHPDHAIFTVMVDIPE